MIRRLIPMLVLAASTLAFAAESVVIDTAHQSEKEKATRDELQRVISKYHLAAWSFTHRVLIDENSIPHSHPVLTIHIRHLGQEDALLSTYVHEQLHWFFVAHSADTDAAIADLKNLYPEVPVGYPEGANDTNSTYLHLLVCYEEGQFDSKLMGSDRAKAMMEFWSKDHYRWVYRTVHNDADKIENVIQAHKLVPPEVR
ncbi:hypothetical protein Acid345_2195 [Candidatus Koribacter versatilis Ellin345]|uniref:Uncharacterized protein n=1 Tax=Koribacter versatilis (strain Ellin345) TaxID=204669 RepID=Q1IPK4_KORVE|nr:hypothetical protein [Candidatus Koribacter versatilis]ABF41196.1 hypothetical protein Acid345_2195 [Candidatus Koribacter versatilis Ellin345]